MSVSTPYIWMQIIMQNSLWQVFIPRKMEINYVTEDEVSLYLNDYNKIWLIYYHQRGEKSLKEGPMYVTKVLEKERRKMLISTPRTIKSIFYFQFSILKYHLFTLSGIKLLNCFKIKNEYNTLLLSWIKFEEKRCLRAIPFTDIPAQSFDAPSMNFGTFRLRATMQTSNHWFHN